MLSMVAAAQSGGSGFSLIILLLPILLIAWLFLSQRKRAQATARNQAAMQVGDEVCTTSGLFGTLRTLDETTADLEIAPGTVVTFDRRALLPGPAGRGRTASTVPVDASVVTLDKDAHVGEGHGAEHDTESTR